MNAWEVLAFALGVAGAVIMVYRATVGCRHEWKRVSAWDRTYLCRKCGESRG